MVVRSNGHVLGIWKKINKTCPSVTLAPRFDGAIILECVLVLHAGACEVGRRSGKARGRVRMTQQNTGNDSVALEDTDSDLDLIPQRVTFFSDAHAKPHLLGFAGN